MSKIKKQAKDILFDATSWLAILLIVFGTISLLFIPHTKANTRTGQMIMHFKKENSDANETYNSMGFSQDSPKATTASGTTSTNTFSSAAPALCESADNT